MDLAEQLLEAHVAYQIAELKGDALPRLVTEQVDLAMTRMRKLRLRDVVTPDQVKAVAAKYVSTFRLPGAIPEVAGEVATRVRSHPANETQLGEVVPRRHVAAAVEKIAELRAVREQVTARIASSPSVQAWLAEYLRSLATGAIATNRRLAERLPGMGTALSIGERLASRPVREADQRSREVAEKAAGAMLRRWQAGMAEAVADDEFALALLELWDDAADRSVRELLDGVSEEDLVDLLVIGHELWLDLRTTPYLQALVDTGIDYVFDSYGELTLDSLLAEFGLDRDDLIEEALRFAPHAISALDDAGLLEDIVRGWLRGFYTSPELQAVLAGAQAR